MKININFSNLSITISKQEEVFKTKKGENSFKFYFYLISIVSIVSISAWIYYYNNNLVLIYNDARSHLNIARRIVDSLQPGLSQIGSVWLPFQHTLELLTIWNDFMFRSGLSGSIISMISYIISAIFIWKLLRLFDSPYFPRIVALLIFCLNPNLLYIQSTPMTESLMLCMLLGMIYFFIKWIHTNKYSDIIFCGIFSFLGILTRYDGWFLFIFISFSIPLITLLKHNKRQIESNFLLYTSLGGFAIFLWFLWNLIIFGDPLFFMNSMYSAKAQQDLLFESGRLQTKYNIGFSFLTYMLVVKENVGELIFILFLVGMIVTFIRVKQLVLKIAVLSLFIPIIFNILSLYLGQSVIHLPYLPPYAYFNDRYGLMALPAVVICIAFLISKKNFLRITISTAIIVLILFQYINLYKTNNIIVLQDALHGASGTFLDDIGRWLRKNVEKDQKILVASSSHDALIFSSSLPLRQFITEGMEKYWKESLKDPTIHASYIIMHDGDIVHKELNANKKFLENYDLVYKGDFSNVYKLVIK